VIAASIALFSAVLVYWFQRREDELARKRVACAEAIADAIAWLELPYRVRRRQDNDKGTLDALAERFHKLHERLLFHENWLRIELPTAHPRYTSAVAAARAASVEAIRAAWAAEPVSSSEQMNVGNLGIDRSQVDTAVADFSAEVTKRLRVIPWSPF